MTVRYPSAFAAASMALLLMLGSTAARAGDLYPPAQPSDDNVQPYLDTVPVANPPIFKDQSDFDGPAPRQPVSTQPLDTPVANAPPRSLDTRNSAESRDRALDLKTADVRPRRLDAPRPKSMLPDYKLGTGDKIRVLVYGEDDLGGEFEVDGSGFVRLPLIGQVQAGGFTIRDFESQVAAQLADGYVNNPRVSAEIVAYRPFFIIGEVNRPGEYPYKNDMNLLTAIALAGGYSYRADESDVYIRRNGSTEEQEYPADATTKILPGDIIRIRERFF